MNRSLAAAMCFGFLIPFAAAAELPPAFNQAELIFTGTVESFILVAQGRSLPPVNYFKITFEKVEMLRGDAPENLSFSYSVRGNDPPAYAKGARLLAGANVTPGSPSQNVITCLVDATDENFTLAKKLAAILPGWTADKDKVVSPWAALGKKAWPEGATLKAEAACAKSGRPALRLGPGVSFKVEQVIPEKVQPYKNPFGDGQFKVIVTNTNKDAVEVPALVTDGKEVLWPDSLFILCDARAYLLPGAGAVAALKDPRPMRLKSGESVSAEIDLLPVEGITWPSGGSRVQFTFCLGDRLATNFFYYFSGYHDGLRDAAIKRLKTP